MRKPRISADQRERLHELQDKHFERLERRKRLYNRRYHKSLLYVSTWVVRVLYFAFLIWLYVSRCGSSGFTDEIVTERHTELTRGKRGRIRWIDLYFETSIRKYVTTFEEVQPPPFKIGDTLQIERNVFGKPSYFTKHNWHKKYDFSIWWPGYNAIALLNIISFFFNNGLERFTDKILWVTWMLNLGTICLYILT